MELLTVKEVATLLRLSDSKVYSMVSRGQLKGHRFGRSVRIEKVSVEQLLHQPLASSSSTKRPASTVGSLKYFAQYC